VEQWLSFSQTQIGPSVNQIAQATFGSIETYQDDYNESLKLIKEHAKNVNTRLASQKWLLGELTVADIFLAGLFSIVFSLCLDTGFQKAMPNFIDWFGRVTKLASFVSGFGNVKLAQKPIKPVSLLQKEKKAAAPKE
jgi:glutathione S-transferase